MSDRLSHLLGELILPKKTTPKTANVFFYSFFFRLLDLLTSPQAQGHGPGRQGQTEGPRAGARGGPHSRLARDLKKKKKKMGDQHSKERGGADPEAVPTDSRAVKSYKSDTSVSTTSNSSGSLSISLAQSITIN